MADVVGSDEGAETAGGDAAQGAPPDETGGGLQASAEPARSEAPATTGNEAAAETETQAQTENSAEPAAEAGTQTEGGDAEAGTDAAGDAEQTQVLAVAAVADAEPVETSVAGAAGAMVISATAAAAAAAPAGPETPSAAPPPASIPASQSAAPAAAAVPPSAPPSGPGGSAGYIPPGSFGGPANGPAGSPSLFGLGRRKALLVGGAAVVVVGGAVAAFAASGSSGGTQNTASGKPGSAVGAADKSSASAAASAVPAVPAALINTVPSNGATGVDPSKPVTVQVQGGTISSVELSGQAQTNGTLSTDGSSWTSDNVLSVDSGYQLTVTAKNTAGKSTTQTVSFRTLSPSATFGVSSVVPPRGSTVGVGQPIRVTFSNYVPQEYQAALEKACVVNTSPAVPGAWYWVSNSDDGAVVDWRPKTFWPVNTQVSIDFNLDGVRLGEHQFGVEDYKAHDFTISDRDLRLIVDKDKFQATCYKNGQVIRTFPIDTGMTTAETFVTYTGTMAVLGKGNPVEMKGNYGPGDTYDDFVNWATQITWSGTYVHAAPWDSDIGYANDDSHGCVHCRTVDAEWFYGLVISGDVVTINGSRARPVTVDNGICTFTLDWPTLLKGSAYGPTVNGKPTSA